MVWGKRRNVPLNGSFGISFGFDERLNDRGLHSIGVPHTFQASTLCGPVLVVLDFLLVEWSQGSTSHSKGDELVNVTRHFRADLRGVISDVR
jgi:hypothetical protein